MSSLDCDAFLQYVGLKFVVGGAGGGAPVSILCKMPSPSGKEAMGKTDAMTAYMLIESRAPFPESEMERYVPLQWTFCRALARALSVHPGCFHAHMLVLGSSRLDAVKMNYSSLLGVFPNALMILTGAPGDGKSVPLWYDTMVMHQCRKQVECANLRLWLLSCIQCFGDSLSSNTLVVIISPAS